MSTSSGFHNLYRPRNLEQVIGHTKAVDSLKGFIQKDKFPSAILFTGPTGCGKTTLARAFASDVLEEDSSTSQNFLETNVSESRTIDDIRGLISVSKLRPMHGKRRFILCDEAQGILSTPASANALLKPLEEPTPGTTWLLTSMEGDKFRSTSVGKAIASRCVSFALSYPSKDELYQQGLLIRKKAKLKFLTPSLLNAVVEHSNDSFRILANHLERLAAIVDGGGTVTEEDVESVLADSTDSEVLSAFATELICKNMRGALRELLDVKDGVAFVRELGWLVNFLLNQCVLKGQRHPRVWGNSTFWSIYKSVQKSELFTLGNLAHLNSLLVTLRISAGAFAVDEKQALSKVIYDYCSTKG